MTSGRSQENSFYRHRVEPRVKLYMPKEQTFLIPMKYIDVTRTTYTSLYIMLENRLKITGTWMEKRSVRCMDRIHKICSIEWEATERIYMVRVRLTRKQKTSRPDEVWPDMWKFMSDAAKKKAKQRWAIEKPKLDNARQLRGIYFSEPDDEEFKLTMKASRRKLEVPMPATMPCKIPIKSSGETHRNIGKRKTKYACVVDADESTDEFYDSLQSCSQIHSDASSFKNSRCNGSSGERMGN